ncbi:MAG: purine-nucleoside phosphorylase [Candidatus Aminicenantes bacterium]|nr:purine-nucleoside phosphorylase [Candidatus Aminicenantes bacterium]MDH5715116.1 purine-nucleoside phosphorylase [Candidatus Aminicenantes bacterium]
MDWEKRLEETLVEIRKRSGISPAIGVILGTGLSHFGENLDQLTECSYTDLPHFPAANVHGHPGRLLIGEWKGRGVVVFQGRFHYYEGYSSLEVTYPVWVMKGMGVRAIVVTTAAGGVSSVLDVGDFMLIKDHINLLGINPLWEIPFEKREPRFLDLSRPYDRDALQMGKRLGKRLSISCKTGVLGAVPGPCYETPAETKRLKRMGIDAVCMSTIPEVIIANYLGFKVLGIAVVSNMASGAARHRISHDEILTVMESRKKILATYIEEVLPQLI